MRDAVITAVGVFVLVTVGTLVAGLAMGQVTDAIALAPFAGAFFGVLTYLLTRNE